MSAGILSSGFIFNFTVLLRIQAYFDDTLTVMWQNIVSDIHIQGQQWKKIEEEKKKEKKKQVACKLCYVPAGIHWGRMDAWSMFYLCIRHWSCHLKLESMSSLNWPVSTRIHLAPCVFVWDSWIKAKLFNCLLASSASFVLHSSLFICSSGEKSSSGPSAETTLWRGEEGNLETFSPLWLSSFTLQLWP